MTDKRESPEAAEASGNGVEHEPVGEGEIPVEVEVEAPDQGAEDPLAALEARIAQLEQEKQDNWDRLLRATADLDNFRKRSRRELDDARFDARTRVLKEMLPVIDNLERALEHAQQQGGGNGGDATGIIEGVKLVLRQFSQALERCEVTAVEAEGKPFDPNVHEAIAQAESADHAAGSIMQVMQRGYKIGERLLRPALVVVAKAPANQPAANGADHDEAGGAAEGEAEER